MLATEPKWTYPAHLELIDGLLIRVAAGELKRLIVTVPVRHGKSEICSRFFPAWLLGIRPTARVVVAGYGQGFAQTWGFKARSLLEQHGQRLFGVTVDKRSRAAHAWSLDTHDGSMYSLGVGGQLTGRGADALVIDDPFKNAEEADSEVLREKIWDWYWSTAYSRLEPGGAVVLLMARWHEDDLVGRLLLHPDDGIPWTVVNLPALADEQDPLGRQPGEALWPERYPKERLEGMRKAIPARWWAALYQQRPAPAEGIMFKRADFRYFTERERMVGAAVERTFILNDDDRQRVIDAGHCRYFQTVDVAASEKETADWTVVATWAATPDKDLILLEIDRQHFETLQVAQFLRSVSDRWGNPPLFIEQFGAGRVPLGELVRAGYPARGFTHGEGRALPKDFRAEPAQMRYQAHKVFHPLDRASNLWLTDYEEEIVSFPQAKNDDQVDVVAYAARLLPRLGAHGPAPQREVERVPPFSAGLRGMTF